MCTHFHRPYCRCGPFIADVNAEDLPSSVNESSSAIAPSSLSTTTDVFSCFFLAIWKQQKKSNGKLVIFSCPVWLFLRYNLWKIWLSWIKQCSRIWHKTYCYCFDKFSIQCIKLGVLQFQLVKLHLQFSHFSLHIWQTFLLTWRSSWLKPEQQNRPYHIRGQHTTVKTKAILESGNYDESTQKFSRSL